MKILRSASLALLLSFSASGVAASGNGLWMEGKDHPDRRVNANLKALAPDSFLKIAEAVDESVVNIFTKRTVKRRPPMRRGPERPPNAPPFPSPFDDYFGDDFFERFFGGPGAGPRQERPQQSLGSGFVLSTEGYLVTNNHVIEHADEINVLLSDESERAAKVVGRDPKTDLALLKIEPGKAKLKPVILGDSEVLKVGDLVVAIGNPFGFSHSVTQGIVSAKERSIQMGPYDAFIQTDASINPGNSGGPLLNLQGEVVGINAAIVASGQGIGFAIPINLAKDVLFKLKSGGRVVRGWLGVLIQEIGPEHAEALKLPDRKGALVSDVQKGSPAEKAGILAGDVVVRFQGKEIKTWHDLPMAVANAKVGETVRVDVIRDGKPRSIEAKIGELKDETTEVAGEEKQNADLLGLAVRDITPEMAKAMGLDEDTKGVLITDVAPSGPASKGVREGDVVIEVNRKKTPTVSAYRQAIKGLKKGSSALLLLKRGAGTLFVAFML